MAQPKPSSASSLVAEQPGFAILAVGLALSVIFGLAIKSLFREEVLRERLDQVIAGTGVQYDKISFRLARGALPDFSVIVNQVHYENQDPCLLKPSVDIHEVRLPFSILSLLSGRVRIEKIEIDSAIALLRTESRECNKDRSPSSIMTSPGLNASLQAAEAAAPVTAATSPENKEKARWSESYIPKVEVHRLRLNYLPVAFASMELQDLYFKIQTLDPLSFSLESDLEFSSELAARGSVQLDYDAKLEKFAQLKLKGNWREGKYSLILNAEKKSKKYDLIFKAVQLPLTQMAHVLKKYNLVDSHFSGRQAWLSFDLSSEGTWTHMTQARWESKNLKLEGDLGDVEAQQIVISTIEPLQFEPIHVSLIGLNFDQLLDFLGQPHPSSAINKLGNLRGELMIKSKNDISFKGHHEGLEFIFANKGSREILQIKSAEIDARLDEHHWLGVASNVVLGEGGDFVGSIEFQAPRDGHSMLVIPRFEKLTLQPAVENLLTQGGRFPALAGDLKLEFFHGKLHTLAGHLSGTDGVIEGVKITKPSFYFQSSGPADQDLTESPRSKFQFRMTADSMEVPRKSPTGEYFELLEHQTNTEVLRGMDPIQINLVSTEFETNSLSDFKWRNFQCMVGADKLNSHGGWDEGQNLNGEMKIFDSKKKKSEEWIIKGTRSQPLLATKLL